MVPRLLGQDHCRIASGRIKTLLAPVSQYSQLPIPLPVGAHGPPSTQSWPHKPLTWSSHPLNCFCVKGGWQHLDPWRSTRVLGQESPAPTGSLCPDVVRSFGSRAPVQVQSHQGYQDHAGSPAWAWCLSGPAPWLAANPLLLLRNPAGSNAGSGQAHWDLPAHDT